MITPLVIIGGGALLLALAGKKKPSNVLGAEGSRSSVVRGPNTGILYPVAWGEPGGDGRAVYSVYSPQNKLLFTFIQDGNGQNKSLMARSEHSEQVNAALEDFGFAPQTS